MVEFILIGCLFVCVIVLAILLYKEKQNSCAKYDCFRSDIQSKFEELSKSILDVNETSEISNKELQKQCLSLNDAIADANQKFQDADAERREQISGAQLACSDSIRETSAILKQEMLDEIEKSHSNLDTKFNSRMSEFETILDAVNEEIEQIKTCGFNGIDNKIEKLEFEVDYIRKSVKKK